jgi:BASS family bile acid:Na+ symporter
MIRVSDFILLLVIFISMAVGIFSPNCGVFLQPYPLYFMMFLLFLSFLSINLSDIKEILAKQWYSALWLAILKLILMPVAVYYALRLTCPSFATAGLLLTGISTGVVAPFIATLVRANTPLVLLIVVITSLFVPFTLPVLVKILVGKTMVISLFSMMKVLGMVIFIPILIVEVLRKWAPTAEKMLLKFRYPVSLIIFTAINLGVFSKYSSYFHQQPGIILTASFIALALGGIFVVSGVALFRRAQVGDRIASAVIMGNMNNVLVIVFASQFFGPREATLAAMYMIPFFLLIFPLKMYKIGATA